MSPRRRKQSRPGLTELGAMRRFNRAAWVARIRAALEAADGKSEPAAEALGVSQRQLMRWLAEGDFDDVKGKPGRPWPKKDDADA